MRICSGFMLHIDVLLLPLLPLSRKYFNNFINLPSSKRAMHTHTQTHFCACHWRVYATVHLCCNLQPINGVAVLPLLLLFSFRIFFTNILNCHILWHSWVYLDNNNVRLYYQFIVVVVAAVFFFFWYFAWSIYSPVLCILFVVRNLFMLQLNGMQRNSQNCFRFEAVIY